MADPSDHDVVIDALADGLSIVKVARRYGLPQAEVRRMLKEATELCYNGEAMREAWALEDRRLQAVGLKFFHKAMDDGNPSDALVFIKASERRATLAGANMPQAHVLHVATQPVDKRTSTEKLRDVFDNIMHITHRERVLLDKRDIDQETLSDNEASELDALTIERETKHPRKTAS